MIIIIYYYHYYLIYRTLSVRPSIQEGSYNILKLLYFLRDRY